MQPVTSSPSTAMLLPTVVRPPVSSIIERPVEQVAEMGILGRSEVRYYAVKWREQHVTRSFLSSPLPSPPPSPSDSSKNLRSAFILPTFVRHQPTRLCASTVRPNLRSRITLISAPHPFRKPGGKPWESRTVLHPAVSF